METYNIIILIFGILLLGILIVLYFINRMLQYKTKIDNSFIAVKDILEDRIKIIDSMLKFIENNLEHEKSYQKRLVESKELILKVKNNKEGIKLIKKTEKHILEFTKLENTYKNLAKNKEYLNVKETIISNKEKLLYAIDSYDKGVINYNNYRGNKLIYILSKICRIPEYDCYNK